MAKVGIVTKGSESGKGGGSGKTTQAGRGKGGGSGKGGDSGNIDGSGSGKGGASGKGGVVAAGNREATFGHAGISDVPAVSEYKLCGRWCTEGWHHCTALLYARQAPEAVFTRRRVGKARC